MSNSPRIGAPFEAQFNAGRAQEYVIQRLLGRINTAQLVRVEAVYPTTGTVGFVDVRPLVSQVATDGTIIAAQTMFRQPYVRVQGGPSAVILDPAVGDIGIALFSQNDISAAVSTREPGGPATARTFDAGDGLYIGGVLNGDPSQFVQFLPDAAGIVIQTPGSVTVDAGGAVTVTAREPSKLAAPSWTVRGPVEFVDPITTPEATINGLKFTAHRHTSASPGSPTSAPIP